jgi:hypothetical protein
MRRDYRCPQNRVRNFLQAQASSTPWNCSLKSNGGFHGPQSWVGGFRGWQNTGFYRGGPDLTCKMKPSNGSCWLDVPLTCTRPRQEEHSIECSSVPTQSPGVIRSADLKERPLLVKPTKVILTLHSTAWAGVSLSSPEGTAFPLKEEGY